MPTISEDREAARASTIGQRQATTSSLIAEALVTEDHWLAFNYIDAARIVWGKSYCEDFDKMAVHALRRARAMQDEFVKLHPIASR